MKNAILSLAVGAASLATVAAHASCASAPPSSVLNLTHWKLTLPVDSHNGTSGEAAEVEAPDLADGYRSGYFCVNPAGGVKFWAPVDGATTDDSEYPRSELRYMLDPNDDNANWAPDNDNASLSARLLVERVPTSTQKVVIGQVHGFQTNAWIKLRYQYHASSHTGSIAALVNQDPSSSNSTNVGEIYNLPNGEALSYSITVASREITIKVNGRLLTSFHVQSGWLHVPMYFKAGSYDQASGSNSTDGGRVTFYSLGANAQIDGGGDPIFESGLEQ
ncbi:MAG TPA: polysaccharide lyase family 7 protein [Rhodanobacteraceae bacterium]|nr:polysaccharide lyase family 7 protein [Rhodanobacteraceae bacterium]